MSVTIVDTIVSELKSNSNVTNVVSARIFQDYADARAAMPYIVINKISSQRHPNLAASSGLVNSRVQVDCTGSSLASRDTLGDAVVQALYTKTGSIGSTAASNDQSVQYANLDDDRHDTVPPERSDKRGGQKGIFTRQLDFMVWHTETVP